MDESQRLASTAGQSGRAVDVEAFAEARTAEIKYLANAVVQQQRQCSKRAFQILPRRMRRRAASHNIKRIPKTLRARATLECEKSSAGAKAKEKTKKRHINPRKQRRTRQRIAQEFQDRQGTKKWLETHIWHAKRMHMVDQWGYRLANYPNDKGRRAMHRAHQFGAAMYDCSYISCLALTASSHHALQAFMAPFLNDTLDGPYTRMLGHARYTSGAHEGQANLYDPATLHQDACPPRLIAPIQYHWLPTTQHDEKVTLWLWIHAAAYDDILHCMSKCLSESHSGDAHDTIHLADLRGDLNRFRFHGPRSHLMLHTILTPHPHPNHDASRHVWEEMKGMTSTASLPAGGILSLLVQDPRLSTPHTLPPRPSPNYSTVRTNSKWLHANDWHHLGLVSPQTSLWSAEERTSLAASKASDHSLSERRAAVLLPGLPLPFDVDQDARVPILLVQRPTPTSQAMVDTALRADCCRGTPVTPTTLPRHLQPASSRKRHDSRGHGDAHAAWSGWDLVLPKGWAMPFWKAMVALGVRVGGLRDHHELRYECGLPAFPHDYPGTLAYDALCQQDEASEGLAAFLRRPKGKRVAHETWLWRPTGTVNARSLVVSPPTKDAPLDVAMKQTLYALSPFRTPWELLPLFSNQPQAAHGPSPTATPIVPLPATLPTTIAALWTSSPTLRLHLLCGAALAHVLWQSPRMDPNELDPSAILLVRLTKRRKSHVADDTRGTLKKHAFVYASTPTQPNGRSHRQTLSLMTPLGVPKRPSTFLGHDTDASDVDAVGTPSSAVVATDRRCTRSGQSGMPIGFLTSGGYSLQQGRTAAIACLSARAFVRLVQASTPSTLPTVCVQNIGEPLQRSATITPLLLP